jgi:hypothetical protein
MSPVWGLSPLPSLYDFSNKKASGHKTPAGFAGITDFQAVNINKAHGLQPVGLSRSSLNTLI